MTGSRHPLVSIITPSLNPGDRILRCLESVSRQTYRNIEHIVIDGGSSDGTLELLKESSVRWISEPDEGQSNAINKGFRVAQGEVVGWLNADDVLKPATVSRVVDAFTRDRSVGWTYGDVEVVTGGRVEIERPDRVDRPLRWAAGNLAAQPGSFFASWALERVGFLDESFHFMMDLELWLRLIDADIKSAYIPEVLATFEVHGSSKSGSIPHSNFIGDEIRARAKTGRLRSASIGVGRLAAWQAYERGDRLGFSEEDATQLASRYEVDLDRDLVLAGAIAERGILEVKRRGWRGVSALLAPAGWRYPETRYRIVKAAGRELRRKWRNFASSVGFLSS